jgi:hypothetical protein
MQTIPTALLLVLLAVNLKGFQAACPTQLITDCIAWTIAGGQCQSLHFVIRIRDQLGNPVNGASVSAIPSVKTSGKQQNVRVTASTTGYTAAINGQCPADPFPYSGTTPAWCWQQASAQLYTANVIGITLPGCPAASFNAADPNNHSEFVYVPGSPCT